MAEKQVFKVQELQDGQWIDVKEYSGFGSQPWVSANLQLTRLVTTLADQSRYRITNQNGQVWRSTKMTPGG